MAASGPYPAVPGGASLGNQPPPPTIHAYIGPNAQETPAQQLNRLYTLLRNVTRPSGPNMLLEVITQRQNSRALAHQQNDTVHNNEPVREPAPQNAAPGNGGDIGFSALHLPSYDEVEEVKKPEVEECGHEECEWQSCGRPNSDPPAIIQQFFDLETFRKQLKPEAPNFQAPKPRASTHPADMGAPVRNSSDRPSQRQVPTLPKSAILSASRAKPPAPSWEPSDASDSSSQADWESGDGERIYEASSSHASATLQKERAGSRAVKVPKAPKPQKNKPALGGKVQSYQSNNMHSAPKPRKNKSTVGGMAQHYQNNSMNKTAQISDSPPPGALSREKQNAADLLLAQQLQAQFDAEDPLHRTRSRKRAAEPPVMDQRSGAGNEDRNAKKVKSHHAPSRQDKPAPSRKRCLSISSGDEQEISDGPSRKKQKPYGKQKPKNDTSSGSNSGYSKSKKSAKPKKKVKKATSVSSNSQYYSFHSNSDSDFDAPGSKGTIEARKTGADGASKATGGKSKPQTKSKAAASSSNKGTESGTKNTASMSGPKPRQQEEKKDEESGGEEKNKPRNKRVWKQEEHDELFYGIKARKDYEASNPHVKRLLDVSLMRVVLVILRSQGRTVLQTSGRTPNAMKGYWCRYGRAIANYDERDPAKTRSKGLQTCTQKKKNGNATATKTAKTTKTKVKDEQPLGDEYSGSASDYSEYSDDDDEDEGYWPERSKSPSVEYEEESEFEDQVHQSSVEFQRPPEDDGDIIRNTFNEEEDDIYGISEDELHRLGIHNGLGSLVKRTPQVESEAASATGPAATLQAEEEIDLEQTIYGGSGGENNNNNSECESESTTPSLRGEKFEGGQ